MLGESAREGIAQADNRFKLKIASNSASLAPICPIIAKLSYPSPLPKVNLPPIEPSFPLLPSFPSQCKSMIIDTIGIAKIFKLHIFHPKPQRYKDNSDG
jgi:hypothetical protein